MDDTKEPETDSSGRFVLRIDPGLHAALRAAAREAGLSLNEYCARKLALPAGSPADYGGEAVERAAAQFGDALLGVVVFGSWARRQDVGTSDVDLLIVVDASVDIRRELYRRWDAAPLYWHDHPIEPHIVRLPSAPGRISGLWAEVAMDGVILFERGHVVSMHLTSVRQAIAAGRLVRRHVHGQSYWVETEQETNRGQEAA
jgi:hypothetical protein